GGPPRRARHRQKKRSKLPREKLPSRKNVLLKPRAKQRRLVRKSAGKHAAPKAGQRRVGRKRNHRLLLPGADRRLAARAERNALQERRNQVAGKAVEKKHAARRSVRRRNVAVQKRSARKKLGRSGFEPLKA